MPGVSAACAAFALAGCAHLGPSTVYIDRFDYNTAIGESWKQQTLLNIVKIHHMDLPTFVDVASIVSGYSLETSASLGGELSSSGGSHSNKVTLGGASRFTDRPTITYVPMTGDKFMRSLLTPIDPKNVFFMLQSGYAADFLLGLSVDSINGVNNRSITGASFREADPEFVRLQTLMRELQLSGAIGMRVEQSKGKDDTTLLVFRSEGLSPDIAAKAAELRQILKLEDRKSYRIVYSPVRGAGDELAVTSRSMMQIMGTFGTYIDTPMAHLPKPSSPAGPALAAAGSAGVMIRSGDKKPAEAFAAVQYRGHWYWIEEDNWQAKRALTSIMLFFTLTDAGGESKLPLITIPAQ
jgi:hypothetical protein